MYVNIVYDPYKTNGTSVIDFDGNGFQLAIFHAKIILGGLGKLAEKMHVTRQTIKNWEKSKVLPKEKNIKMISEIVKVDEELIRNTNRIEGDKEPVNENDNP